MTSNVGQIDRILNPEMLQGILDCWKSFRDSGGDYRTASGIVYNEPLGRYEVLSDSSNPSWDFWTWLMSCLPPDRFPDLLTVLEGYSPSLTSSSTPLPVAPEPIQVRLSDIVEGTGIKTAPIPPRKSVIHPSPTPPSPTPPSPAAPVDNNPTPALPPESSSLEDSATGFLDMSDTPSGLFFLKNISSGERIDIPDFPFIVGRSSKSSSKSLGLDEMLSRQHCSLRSTPEGVEVIDLGSRNGTFLGAHRLSPNTPTLAAEGTLLRLGTLTFTVERG